MAFFCFVPYMHQNLLTILLQKERNFLNHLFLCLMISFYCFIIIKELQQQQWFDSHKKNLHLVQCYFSTWKFIHYLFLDFPCFVSFWVFWLLWNFLKWSTLDHWGGGGLELSNYWKIYNFLTFWNYNLKNVLVFS